MFLPELVISPRAAPWGGASGARTRNLQFKGHLDGGFGVGNGGSGGLYGCSRREGRCGGCGLRGSSWVGWERSGTAVPRSFPASTLRPKPLEPGAVSAAHDRAGGVMFSLA